MIDRRDTLRLGLLALAVLGGTGTLAACTGQEDPGSEPVPDELDGIELVSSDVERAAGDGSLVPDVVAGLHGLAGGLYRTLATEPGNVVLSPYSVLVALGMTLTGAAGRTAEEMRDVLGASDLGDRWHKGANALTSYVDGLAGEQGRADGSKAELELATANQVFGQQGVGWSADFLDLLAKEYGAALRAVDFEGATEQARTRVNDWVEQQTNDRIVDLLPEGSLDPSTRMVLVNAIYLKAPWEQPFEEGLTAAGDFRRADGTTVQVDLMRNPMLSGALATGDGWRAATVPYAGRGLAMTVVLPDGPDLTQVEEQAARDLAPFIGSGQPTNLDLHLPRWSFRFGSSLKDALQQLGMEAAFGDADFRPMTDEDLDLYVDDVFHQGFIAVDEEGTEAAAATAVVMAETSAPVTVEVKVDRPFLFVIHDLEHGTPLFLGRVADPTA
ncbi:serpin family protein [Nocardioides sp. J54]|uniref:serpin family protein n=1 Tax=Nocardioides sp. J54 TaxID=935866 RepID=UPI00048F64D3|nr:serpin family protein [Nocardioides sp. J54]